MRSLQHVSISTVISYVNKPTAASILCLALAACGGGEDPAEVQAQASADSRSQAMAVAAPAAATALWTKVADQGGKFHVVGTKRVRYGYGTQWVRKSVSGGLTCDVATFGSDPAPTQRKTCEVRDDTAIASVATLQWNASLDGAVAGYKVYYGTSAGNYVQAAGQGLSAGTDTSFNMAGLTVGNSYYFAVTAVDSAGNESEFSNEAVKALK